MADTVPLVSSVQVALIFGGRSSEHSISCISAASVWQALLEAGHSVLPIAITPEAGMVRYPGSVESLRADALPVVTAGDGEVSIPVDPTVRGVVIDGRVEHVDVVFPVLHGPWGEDGTIQGLLELAGLPYVGSGVLASALCMDKITLKTVLRAAGIPVAPWVAVDAESWSTGRAEVLGSIVAIGPEVFVKPSRAGSSVGITKVHVDPADFGPLETAIEHARTHDPRVIVEAAVSGAREIECGVRQLASGERHASRCAEIVVHPDFEFYDFEAKYLSDGADLVVPADLEPRLADEIRDLSLRCFAEAGCEGLARVDFFVGEEGIVVNEVNTMPGFTSISMYPRMWQATSVDYVDLVDSLVAEALARRPGLR